MNTRDWDYQASVFRAGAERARGWSHNTAMQQQAEVLEAQADRCDEIARELDGNPLVVHTHYHWHNTPAGPVLHCEKHEHAAGETDHDLHGYAPLTYGQLTGGTS